MREVIKRGVLLSAAFILSMLIFSGCTQVQELSVITDSAIKITDKGVVTSYLVDDFDKAYYDLAELEQMVMDEVNQYMNFGSSDGKSISVEAVELLEENSSKAMVALKYDSVDLYKDFNGVELFYGTVAQANEAGYDLDITMTDGVSDGVTIGKDQIYDMGKQYILIVEDKVRIICPKKIQYISEGAVLESDGSVNASQDGEYTYIIMK